MPGSPGLAHGPAFVFFHSIVEIPVYGVDVKKHDKEIHRFNKALEETKRQIRRIRGIVAESLGEGEAKIFDAHLLVIEDKALIDETIVELKQTSFNIDYCFHTVSKRYQEAFDYIDDEYIKERATDIRDVSKRVLSNMLGQNPTNLMRFTDKRIIISEDLIPSVTAEIEKDCILAIAINKGSRTSHSVIMARSLQIPVVVCLNNVTENIKNGDYVIVDGNEGVVVINPTEKTLLHYTQIKRERQNIQKIFESVNSLPSQTKDGVRIPLMINIKGTEDLKKLQVIGADGVGLFRTEGLFFKKDKILTEEEQFEAYKKVIEALNPLPVTIRTLDLGGDRKTRSWFQTTPEANPFMGCRAIRLCLENRELFKTQLRALLRASVFGNLKIMYPMITSPDEIIHANEILQEAKEELKTNEISFIENIDVGCMIETPSAALVADLLTDHCSFFSIGTNDLIQYTLAVDRDNDRISHMYQPNHPAVLRLIHHAIRAAVAKNIPISICGEMGGDPLYVPLLLGMGINGLSVTPGSLPEVKYIIRQIETENVQHLAKSILAEDDPSLVLKTLREYYLAQLEHIVH